MSSLWMDGLLVLPFPPEVRDEQKRLHVFLSWLHSNYFTVMYAQNYDDVFYVEILQA